VDLCVYSSAFASLPCLSNKIVVHNGKQGYTRIYDYGGKYYIVSGIGTNGFIVSAYPVGKE